MRNFAVSILFSILFVIPSFAQEGMWLLTQLDQLELNKKGLTIPVNDLYSKDKPGIFNAVLQIGGGTGSFVSPEGLVLTNHHVAFTAVQRASSTTTNYLTHGFLAVNKAEEIKAEGYTALMVTDIQDVTDKVLEGTTTLMDPPAREKKIDTRIAEMTKALEKDKTDISVNIVSMYNGKQYLQFTYKEFKDLRIVYVPPMSIGNYGGETDNWMWPRHTGDFSFLRVYVSPDGTGKEYDPENIPYKPKAWLKTAKEPLKEGDFTFVIGFPGFTTRYRSSTSVHWNQEYNYPFSIKNYSEVIDLATELTKNDPEGKLKVASLVKGLANVMKNYQGKVEGMKKTNFLQEKIDFEKQFNAWANSTPANKEKYGNILEKEKQQYTLVEKTRERDNALSLFDGLSGLPLGMAGQVYFLVKELEKPLSERRPGISEETIKKTIDKLSFAYDNYYEPVDKALFIRALKMTDTLKGDRRIKELEYILQNPAKNIQQYADEAFASTRLKDPEYTKSLFSFSSKKLEALDDPFMKLAVKLYPLNEQSSKNQEVFSAHVISLRKDYMDALFAWKGKTLYPDANSTIRFTSGNVKGYKPRNAVWYAPFTSLEGIVEKNTGIEPFDAPASLIELSRKKDFGLWEDKKLKDVPLAFLSTCDITGGNSGSPIMNAKGEIAGVIFDGNYEAMISDWQYDENLQRAISCDIRYVLFITQKFSHADSLLREMQAIK